MSTIPSGIGIYARQLSRSTHGTPDEMARTLRDHRVSFVALLACWQDVEGGVPRQLTPVLTTLRAYATACAAAGVDVWLWGFPWRGREAAYVDAMAAATRALDGLVRGWLHDPEVSYKAKGREAPRASRGQGEAVDARPDAAPVLTRVAAERLVSLERDAVGALGLPRMSGWSSYGMADWHAMPWHELAGSRGWGSPQLYSVTPKQVDMGIASWRARGFETLLPSVPTFGENSGVRLDDYLGCFVDGNERVDGFVFWSYQQTGVAEWKTIARWAEQLKARACVPRAAS